ncbi:MAG: hypothetical protein R3C15_19130 [Thermoleophilia bacterium]
MEQELVGVMTLGGAREEVVAGERLVEAAQVAGQVAIGAPAPPPARSERPPRRADRAQRAGCDRGARARPPLPADEPLPRRAARREPEDALGRDPEAFPELAPRCASSELIDNRALAGETVELADHNTREPRRTGVRWLD